MATRTIELDRTDLDKSIEVLSSAKTLQLTRFQRFSYRALIVSSDVAVICYLALVLVPGAAFILNRLLLAIVLLAAFVGIVALVLNIPLFLRAFRERARLKKLGLSSLSKSLWKESRRSRWLSRIRGAALMTVIIVLILGFLATRM